MKFIKLTVMSAAMIVAFVSTASAAPVCVDGASMASYQALGSGGCTYGNVLFSNFTYGSTGHGTGVAVANTNVFLTLVGAGSYNPGPSIVFTSSGWVVPSASPTTRSLVDSSIGFTVTALDGSALIEDAGLILSSYSASGSGFVDITETVTPGPTSLQLQVDSGGPFASHTTFAPTSVVTVLKDVLLAVPASADPTSGSVQLGSFEEDFSQAPEPVAALVVGSGLVAIGLLRRRSSQKT
jgi:hypothetical protein